MKSLLVAHGGLISLIGPLADVRGLAFTGMGWNSGGPGRLPLVLVEAPAGSGKTTLPSDWREEFEARGAVMAWIDLAPLHADLGSFFSS